MIDTYSSSKDTLRKDRAGFDSARSILQAFIVAKAAAMARFGYLERAEKILAPLVSQSFATEDVFVLMARIYAQQRRWDDAKRMARHILELYPLNIEARKILNRMDSVRGESARRVVSLPLVLLFVLLGASAPVYWYWTPVEEYIDSMYAAAFPPSSTARQLLANETEGKKSEPRMEISILEDIPTTAKSQRTAPPPPKNESTAKTSSAMKTKANSLTPAKKMTPEDFLASPQGLTGSLKDRTIAILNGNDLLDKYFLQVVQKEGVIEISGEVPSAAIRGQIENLAHSVNDGSQAVDSRNLLVQELYAAQTGDSLWTIARQKYGDPNYWKIIARANDLATENHIQVGQKLFLPNLDGARKMGN